MILIFPYTHENMSVKRLPWVTFALILANVLIYMFTLSTAVPEAELNDSYIQFLKYFYEHPYLEAPKGSEEIIGKHRLEELQQLKDQIDTSTMSGDDIQSEQDQLNTFAKSLLTKIRKNVLYRFGNRPDWPIWWSFITSQFLHAGLMHLLGNMLFLYLAGAALEDLWGRPLFLCFYLASGILAAITHDLKFPMSDSPLVGASGAIAGLMGAFLVRLFRTKISFFYMIFVFIRGTFKSPAWVVLPFWLLQQMWMASLLDEGSTVAFWAHIGGFAFGALFAISMDLARFEQKYITPYIEKEAGIARNPLFDKALDLAAKSDYVQAARLLKQVIQKEPDHLEAHMELRQIAEETHNDEAYRQYSTGYLEALIRQKDRDQALDVYNQYQSFARSANKPLPAKTILALGSFLEEIPEYRTASELYDELIQNYPSDPLAMKAYTKLIRLCMEKFDDRKRGTELLMKAHQKANAIGQWKAILENDFKRYNISIPPAPVVAPTGIMPAPKLPINPQTVLPETHQTEPKSTIFRLPNYIFDGGDNHWQTIACVIESMDANAVSLKNEQQLVGVLNWGKLKFLSVGRIRVQQPGEPKPKSDFLVLDLVSNSQSGGIVLYRIYSHRFTFKKIFPGLQLTSSDAYQRMLNLMLNYSSADCLPNQGKCLGPNFVIYPGLPEYDAHLKTRLSAPDQI